MAKEAQITFKIDDDVKQRLIIEADKQRRSLSSLLNILIEDYLKKK